MNASPAVIELFEALRRSSLGSDSHQEARPDTMPVASVLQCAGSNGKTDEHRYDSLRAALAQRRNGSLRKLARELGFEDKDAGTLSDLLHGRYDHVSLDTANRWARALGLPLIPPTCRVPVCPTCGGDHGMKGIPDCHGRAVAAVVTLAPGEVVRQNGHAAQRKEPPCFRPRLSRDPAERIAQCERIIEEARGEL